MKNFPHAVHLCLINIINHQGQQGMFKKHALAEAGGALSKAADAPGLRSHFGGKAWRPERTGEYNKGPRTLLACLP